MQYLVVDTGKLYHHKIRLDSVLKRQNVTRQDVLNYIKTKHHLYFVNGKLKDTQLYKFIDKILSRKGLAGLPLQNANFKEGTQTTNQQQQIQKKQKDDDFDYLNDEQQQEYYDQDYQDYEDPSNFANHKVSQNQKQGSMEQKNKFMAYQQQDQEGEGHAKWDLDLDENDDFV